MYMWLTGNQVLDFMTINRFRSKRMKDVILDVFTEVVNLLIEEKYIKFENYFLDGTKIEANANKYSYVRRNGKRPDRGVILLGFGLDHFSMNPVSIPVIKETIRSLSAEKCRKIANTALTFSTSEEVENCIHAALH